MAGEVVNKGRSIHLQARHKELEEEKNGILCATRAPTLLLSCHEAIFQKSHPHNPMQEVRVRVGVKMNEGGFWVLRIDIDSRFVVIEPRFVVNLCSQIRKRMIPTL